MLSLSWYLLPDVQSLDMQDWPCEHVPQEYLQERFASKKKWCIKVLGNHFSDVYAYLKGVRTTDVCSSDSNIIEGLKQIVGKELMHVCFQVDQLIFQELFSEAT